MQTKQIIIETDEQEFTFKVTGQAYNKYLNSTTPTNKIQPATNFLLATVEDTQKKDLKTLLQQPGAALHMVGTVIEDYTPEFNFSVKKSKSEPNE